MVYKRCCVRSCYRLRSKWGGVLHTWRVEAYIREEKHFNWQTVNLTFLSFFQYKARISAFFLSCEKCSKLTIKKPEYVTLTIKLKIKTLLTSLLLTLNIFHFLLQCFYCWLWSVNCCLGELSVVLTLCACWNQIALAKCMKTLEEEWHF